MGNDVPLTEMPTGDGDGIAKMSVMLLEMEVKRLRTIIDRLKEVRKNDAQQLAQAQRDLKAVRGLLERTQTALRESLGSLHELHMETYRHDEEKCEACSGSNRVIWSFETYEEAKAYFSRMKREGYDKIVSKRPAAYLAQRPATSERK